jgi:hypothetical protein
MQLLYCNPELTRRIKWNIGRKINHISLGVEWTAPKKSLCSHATRRRGDKEKIQESVWDKAGNSQAKDFSTDFVLYRRRCQ